MEAKEPEVVKKPLIGEVDAKTIEAWKKKYPQGIYGAKTKGTIAYFQNPLIDHLNYAQSKQDPDKMLDKWKALADKTFIGGCEELLTNDRLFIGIVWLLQDAARGEEAELVNL